MKPTTPTGSATWPSSPTVAPARRASPRRCSSTPAPLHAWAAWTPNRRPRPRPGRAEAPPEHQPRDRDAGGRRRAHHPGRHPGYADFQADVIEALGAVDAAILVVDASAWSRSAPRRSGGWPRSEAAALRLRQQDGRENANYDAVLDGLKSNFGPKIAPGLPADRRGGLVPRLHRRHRAARQRLRGRKPAEVAIPDEMRAGEGGAPRGAGGGRGRGQRRADDALPRRRDVSDEEIETAVHKGPREGSVVPVFVGSALKNIGVESWRR